MSGTKVIFNNQVGVIVAELMGVFAIKINETIFLAVESEMEKLIDNSQNAITVLV